METTPIVVSTEEPVCQAARYVKELDDRLNGAARQEFEDATSKTQESGADLDGGSAYLDDGRTIVFREESVACGLCKGVAMRFSEGSVSAPECLVSGYCELDWVKMNPDNYKDKDGKLTVGQLVCNPEVGCSALLDLSEDGDGGVTATVARGACEVRRLGINWRERCLGEIGKMVPETGLEKFDGAGSGREED